MDDWWKNYPWRVIQTNMREIDIVGLDVRKFVDDLISFKANTVMVSFGGTMANYRSDVPDHYINPLLEGNEDVLEELVDLCHRNGIKVIARTDFSKMHRSVFEKHEDWAYREGEGQILDINSYVSTCQNGGFQQQFMDSVIEEIITRFKVDGFYCNMGSFMVVDYNTKLHGPCQCDNCRRGFKAMSGMDLPSKDVPFASVKDPAVAAYQKFKGMVMSAQKKRVQSLIKKIDSSVAYCSVDYVRQETNTELGRSLPHWQYGASSNARTIRGCGSSADCADVDFLAFSARETSVTPALQEYRLWQSLANFGGIDFFVMGRLDNKKDKRAYDRVRRVFDYAQKNEALLSCASSDADVLLVRSSYQIPNPEERGWIRLLTELHIPFDETLVPSLAGKISERYRMIILPDKAGLQEGVTQALADYVRNGGYLVSTGGTVLAGNLLKEIHGIESCGEKCGFGSYMEWNVPVPVGDSCFVCTPSTAECLYTLMPPQRFGPPEVCYASEQPAGGSGLYLNHYGKGKAVLLPWKAAALYYSEGYDIWFDFIRYVLNELLGIKGIAPNLSPMVELTVGVSGNCRIVSLVNGTGHFGASFFDPVEVRNSVVEIPWDGENFSCRSLVVQDNCSAEIADGSLRITVGKLGFFEQVIIEKRK